MSLLRGMAVSLLASLCPFVLVGCGAPAPMPGVDRSGPCAKLAGVSWWEKSAACGPRLLVEPVRQAICQGGLGACGPPEQEALDDYALCLGDLPRCRPGLEALWDAEVALCAAHLRSVSDECLGSVGVVAPAFNPAARSPQGG